ncbi:periphilin-1 isoform X2 [Heterocephalus glaber]|uniref:Periphilin-1 isoform X2 n=1 Tax=Heterocephalus glaber TaxID=10181 RepID=A0AAX6SHC9_HETGA|nr:periphilin-1 isoform X2 [Heterocephalus glaber]
MWSEGRYDYERLPTEQVPPQTDPITGRSADAVATSRVACNVPNQPAPWQQSTGHTHTRSSVQPPGSTLQRRRGHRTTRPLYWDGYHGVVNIVPEKPPLLDRPGEGSYR